MLRRESDAAPAAFQPGTGDLYRARGMTFRFERGTDGKVTALVVDAGRVRDIRFSRLPESKPQMDTDWPRHGLAPSGLRSDGGTMRTRPIDVRR